VNYYSGAATYKKSFQLPSGFLVKDQHLYLDLGQVAVMAEVKLNGRDLGTLWKPPFRVDVTSGVTTGENVIEIRVVNLWCNRMIGDEQLPEDSSRKENGTLKEWPRWLEEGQPSPSGRYTFTSWRLWKKSSPLQQSGLLGPVTFIPVAEIGLAAHR
jgi:(4-O-methyl)-D-glucuronate---lignin esterase